MIEGRVIRMLDDEQLILNVGSDHGVERKMLFDIYTPRDKIIDPETGEELGDLRKRKARLAVLSVKGRFCVAGPPPRVRTALSAALSPTLPLTAIEETPKLPVDQSQLEPLPTGSRIRIGDIAEQVTD